MENGKLDIISEDYIDELSHKMHNEEDEKAVMLMLSKRTEIDVLWRIYKEFVDAYIISNNELKQVMFHVLLGAYFSHNDWYYIESGEKKSMRLHTFVIQDSGTGKSQTFKTIGRLFDYLEVPCRIALKDNESALTGSIWEDPKTGKPMKKEGLFSELDVWISDEGSLLLKNVSFNESLTDYLQMVMDEPGKVVKGMRMGSIEYKSKTTIVAGSYMFEEFQETVMEKGLLQRMFVLIKEFTEEEERNIRIGKNLLKLITKTDRLEALKAKFKERLLLIKVPSGAVINFNKEDTQKFSLYMETVYDEYIAMQFSGNKQTILKTFFNRVHTQIDKIASQRAIVNGHDEVRYDDMMYAADIVKLHLLSVQRIFEKIKSKKGSNPFDDKCKQVFEILKTENKRMTKKALLLKLRELHNIGRWDFAYNRTTAFIMEMEKRKVVNITKMENGEELVILE